MDLDYLLSISNIQFFPISTSSIVALFFTAFLLCLSALMSASEIAFFSLNPSDKSNIEESESHADQLIQSLLLRSDRLLATLLIWNNFINVAIVVLSAYVFHQFIDFSKEPIIGFVFETILLTFLILLFGEIIPKIYAP